MMTIIRAATNVGTQYRYQGSNGRRGYLGSSLFGTVCESNVLRHIAGNPNAKAPEDWPITARRFERELAEINEENPNLDE